MGVSGSRRIHVSLGPVRRKGCRSFRARASDRPTGRVPRFRWRAPKKGTLGAPLGRWAHRWNGFGPFLSRGGGPCWRPSLGRRSGPPGGRPSGPGQNGRAGPILRPGRRHSGPISGPPGWKVPCGPRNPGPFMGPGWARKTRPGFWYAGRNFGPIRRPLPGFNGTVVRRPAGKRISRAVVPGAFPIR